MNSEQILDKFRETDALLEGHFILSSGRHSPQYLQCALALQYPFDAAKYGKAIAEHFTEAGIETVVSPAIGGLVIGYEVAKALNVRFIWTERKEGIMTLRRGFSIKEGEKILAVEDVITTGGSIKECIDVIKENGGNVTDGASIIDRSGGRADIGVPRISLVELDVPSYEKDNCPMCAEGTEAVKPGSRGN
jgi:orotate phosphoribosyltransferase